MGVRTREEINSIKSQICLSAVVGSTVPLAFVRGRDHKGQCPFHAEKTASFHVDDHRYHCFGCRAHGDIFSWLSLEHGVNFPRAVELAAELIGQTPAPASREFRETIERPDPEARARIIRVNELARVFFSPASRCPEHVSEYIHSRFPTLQSKWDIGYAPLDRHALPVALRNSGITDDEMVEAQICARDVDTGETYSRYRDRVVIPLKDAEGATLGFLGRIVPSPATSKLPKYLCPRNNAAFNKKKYIFGLNWLSDSRVESLIVTEGCIDAISLMTQGVPNVVSTMGCAVSDEQLEILSGRANKIYLLYDGDQAGIYGMADAGNGMPDPKFRALLLPSGEDPDTFARKHQGSTRDQIKLLPNLPACALAYTSKSTIWYGPAMKPEFDLTELRRLTKPYVNDNLENGWPHYNVVPWVIQAYPQYAPDLKRAAERMVSNAEVLEDGTRRIRTDDVVAFIKIWKLPCRDVRKAHAEN